MMPIVEDQHTAARGYFLCVVALLFVEGLLQLPASWLRTCRLGGQRFTEPPSKHWKVRTLVHKLLSLPSPLPFLTNHRAPDLIRFIAFAGLNILWGWNRIKYTTDYKLYGWLTIANGGLALLFAARTNLFSLILRVPSPVLLMYHRWIGIATVLHATLHFGLTADHYIKTEQFSDVLSNSYIQAGLVAWASLCIIAITSIRPIRRRFFEAFYYPHFFFLVFVIGSLVHAGNAPEFLLPGFLLWVVDRGIRFLHNFRTTAVESALQYSGDVVKLKVKGMKSSRPGQIAWVQIPHVSFFNWHPFTIASAPGDDESTFAIRGLGGFTRKVQHLATETRSTRERKEAPTDASGLKVRLDGPYGVGGIQWSEYPVVVLVAGGIGITPGISIATHLIKQSILPKPNQDCQRRQQHIHLLWVVRESSHVMWFDEELANLSALTRDPASTVTFDISIFASGGRPENVSQEEEIASGVGVPQKGLLDVHPGRPNVLEWFRKLKFSRPGLDAAVNLCGPRRLIDDARRAAVAVSSDTGLFHVEEEVFEF